MSFDEVNRVPFPSLSLVGVLVALVYRLQSIAMEDEALIFEFSKMDVNDSKPIILSTSLIHEIFEYIDDDYKLLIHREGSTDEQRSKILSIELIMRSGIEEYFKDVLLCDRWRRKLCKEAARRGYVSTLKWAREQGCDWDSETCEAAASKGHLDCLMWAREHGCDWNSNTCKYAARGGHLDCLIWAREHGCDWTSYTCMFAAHSGHLDCLIWAREHGCDWNSDTCMVAAKLNLQVKILIYLQEVPYTPPSTLGATGLV